MLYCVFAADYYEFTTSPVTLSVSITLFFLSLLLVFVSAVFVPFCYNWLLICHKGGQLVDELLASLATRFPVYLRGFMYFVYCMVTNKYDDDDNQL